MKVEIEHISDIKKKLNIEIPSKRVNVELEAVYHSFKKGIKMKGFRPGKIPRDLIERRYKQQIEEEALSRLINDTYSKTIEEHKLPAVSPPVIGTQKLEKNGEFRYSAVVEVKPELKIEGYLGLEIEKENLQVTDQDVENSLQQIQEMQAELKEIEENRPLKKGDYAFFDCKATLQGKPVRLDKEENISLEIGSNSFLPGFDEKLIDLAKNSEKIVEIDFPDDYQQRDLAGKKVVFQVKLKNIKEKIYPNLDDEFAKDVGSFNTLVELKDQIRNDVENREKNRIQYSLQEQIIDKIIEKNQFEVPPAMIESQINNMIENTRLRLKNQGVDLEKLGGSLDKMRDNYQQPAEKELKTSFILESIAKQESTEVSDEEVTSQLEEIASNTKQSLERIKEIYRQGNAMEELRLKIIEKKTVDFLIEEAKIRNITKS